MTRVRIFLALLFCGVSLFFVKPSLANTNFDLIVSNLVSIFDYNSLVANYGSKQPIIVGDPTSATTAQQFSVLVNNYRVQNGLAPLRVEVVGITTPYANEVAWFANDYATNHTGCVVPLSTTDSLGRDSITRLLAFGAPSRMYYEDSNELFTCFMPSTSPAGMFNNWTSDSYYRSHILSTTHCGMAVGTHDVGSGGNISIAAIEFLNPSIPPGSSSYCNSLPPPVIDTTPPTVTITSPTNGQNISQNTTVNIVAQASDSSSGVKHVEFLVDGVVVGADGTVVYDISWVASVVGSHTISARAYDNAGNVSTNYTITVNVVGPDTISPVVSVTSPTYGQLVKGTVQISANATDNMGISKVELILDGQIVSTDTSSPYSYSWDSTTATKGTHTITAKAYDSSQNFAISSLIYVSVYNPIVDTTPPTVTLTSPTSGQTVSGGQVTLAATVTDNVGPAGVEFIIDNLVVEIDISPPYSYTWNSSTFPSRDYSFSAKAHDTSGNTATTPITVAHLNSSYVPPSTPRLLPPPPGSVSSQPGTFSSLNSYVTMGGYDADLNFNYSGQAPFYYIDIALTPDFSNPTWTYLNLLKAVTTTYQSYAGSNYQVIADSTQKFIIQKNPATTWWWYAGGRKFYWRVWVDGLNQTKIYSPVQEAIVVNEYPVN